MKTMHLAGNWTPLLGVIAAVSGLLAGCHSLEFNSLWHAGPSDIHEGDLDWQRAQTPISGVQAMAGFMNDTSNLYLSFVTDDRSIERQVASRGLTVWLDKNGGSDKHYGIRFPLGMQRGGIPGMERDFPGGPPEGDSLRRGVPLDTSEAELIGPTENERTRVKVIELKKIAVSITVPQGGGISYRLKVPLREIGLDPSRLALADAVGVGVGLETGARSPGRRNPELDRGGGGRGGEMPGGMGRGGGGRRRGGGGGGGGGGFPGGGEGPRTGPQESQPLSVWAKVILANSAPQHP